jgi:sensor histidine kinase YesM
MTTEKQNRPKKLFWQIVVSVLTLVAIGNLIMIIVLGGELPTTQMIVNGSFNSVLVGGLFMFGLTFIIKTLDRKVPWLHFPFKRLILQFIITVIFSLLVIVFAIFLNSLFWHQEITTAYFLQTGSFMTKVALIFVFGGSLISNTILFFKNWKESAVQQEKLKRIQLNLQYETLKSQVSPHFLFNTLNSLTSLISSNPDKAIDFVKKLSEVYRYVLDQKDQELADLASELKFVESYVFLQKIRFETNLDVQIEVSPQNFKVIPLSVQMLVENAIKHNEISDRRPLQIKIYTTSEQYLVVENQLQKKSGSEGSGSGIQNIRERYEFFTTKKVLIYENLEKYRVSIPLLTD